MATEPSTIATESFQAISNLSPDNSELNWSQLSSAGVTKNIVKRQNTDPKQTVDILKAIFHGVADIIKAAQTPKPPINNNNDH